MAPFMLRLLSTYFNQWDGSLTSFDQLEPYFDALFHHDLELHAADGVKDLSTLRRTCVALIEKKCEIEILKYEKASDDTIYYALRVETNDGKTNNLEAKGTFVDGKLRVIQPLDHASEEYARFFTYHHPAWE